MRLGFVFIIDGVLEISVKVCSARSVLQGFRREIVSGGPVNLPDSREKGTLGDWSRAMPHEPRPDVNSVGTHQALKWEDFLGSAMVRRKTGPPTCVSDPVY